MSDIEKQTFEWQAEQNALAVRRLSTMGLLDHKEAIHMLFKIIDGMVAEVRSKRQ
jgi:hypothetical protein